MAEYATEPTNIDGSQAALGRASLSGWIPTTGFHSRIHPDSMPHTCSLPLASATRRLELRGASLDELARERF